MDDTLKLVEPASSPFASGRIDGRYDFVRLIARGGMGEVWLAKDLKLERDVAIKVMSRELVVKGEPKSRFEREARAAAKLKSGYVVQVFDYGIHEGLPFIVMELLEGQTLSRRLKQVGRLSIDKAASLVVQICGGLRAAHAAGLVHRDLKPSNVLLVQRDGREIAKLLDFGVVKGDQPLDENERTTSGLLLGTPRYMSPEQARALPSIDGRSDLWSLAVIIYRMLSGDYPFTGNSLTDVVMAICSDEVPDFSAHAPDYGDAFDRFFARAFTREPEGRFQTAESFAEAFVTACRAALPTLSLDSTLTLAPMIPKIGGINVAQLPSNPPDHTPVSATVGGTPMVSGYTMTSAPSRRWLASSLVAAGAIGLLGMGASAVFLANTDVGQLPTLVAGMSSRAGSLAVRVAAAEPISDPNEAPADTKPEPSIKKVAGQKAPKKRPVATRPTRPNPAKPKPTVKPTAPKTPDWGL